MLELTANPAAMNDQVGKTHISGLEIEKKQFVIDFAVTFKFPCFGNKTPNKFIIYTSTFEFRFKIMLDTIGTICGSLTHHV